MKKIVLTPAQFRKLPRKEKAVLVAKDILAQIKAEKYAPETGSYGTIFTTNEVEGAELINENFDKISKCTVCAIGATIMSCTHLGNQLQFDDLQRYGAGEYYRDILYSNFRDNKTFKKLLTSVFTPKQILLIETSFEGYSSFLHKPASWFDGNHDDGDFKGIQNYDRVGQLYGAKLTFDEAYKCHVNYYMKFNTNEETLIAICKNVIKNNGNFKP